MHTSVHNEEQQQRTPSPQQPAPQRSLSAPRQEVGTLRFTPGQSGLLDRLAAEIAALGGVQSPQARILAAHAATELRSSFSTEQQRTAELYAGGAMSALVFEGMAVVDSRPLPAALPAPEALENDPAILRLGARNQILLKVVEHRAFAYDIDNAAKLVRLVGNFKGGGQEKLAGETGQAELSSHSGLSLGPHTEAPYWCAVGHRNGHSPSPSALILSAMWNPGGEPTSVIPLPDILERIGPTHTLCLTSPSFNFSRSDSFNAGQGEDGRGVSILDFDPRVGFAARFNSYRFTVDEGASELVKQAFAAFCQAVDEARPLQCVLSQESAIVINNTRALHCRDTVRDNRRLLVRVFGYSRAATAITLSDSPLIVQG
ncbi:hypothetical protein M4R22_13865 [Acidovorax sp. GBBC 3334]|uniref:hypothetical protein n=1 Tax=unclassified Acidovorax TaxID=2684926 RepID=UPI002302C571|nr:MULTISPECIES: hypothetical protein [unclassified Acidovorax]MDA8455856.1 hypothetical protein [Acidovorax sp. GBBC 3334]MDA8523083.1 hypothetical protein [Acidovorax sp. NCPPB 4044]